MKRSGFLTWAGLVRLVRFLLRREVRLFPKLVALAAVIYVISPIDLIPAIPFVDWIDDAVVATVAWWFLDRWMRHHSP